ncbi:MAG: hypothetical protein WCA78_07250 [Rhizomicrobium sp.]
MAALGGVVVGLLSGVNETARQWRAGGFDVRELIFFAAAVGALLIVVANVMARNTRKGIPFVSMIAGFAIVGIAFHGLIGDFTGKIAEFFVWASGCSFGAAIGLLLARWMMRRAQRREDK